jgi:hypothetical protein
MKFEALLTRILKVVAIVTLVSLAAFTILLELATISKRNDLHITWHWHVGATLVTALCFCGAYFLVRRVPDPIAEVYCKKCHTLGGHIEISPYRGSVSGAAWHFGGFLFSIFYSASRKLTFRCRACGQKFESHTATTRAYRILFLLMLALVVNFLWSAIDG